MCEYCQKGKELRSINWNEEGQINIDKNGNLYAKDDEVFRINYCPMCRQKVR